MALESMLASAWALDVNTGTEAAPVWTAVKGLSSLKENIESSMEDDSDFDNDGWGSSQVTQRTWKLDCEAKRKKQTGSPTFIPDAGQQFILDAGNLVGVGSNVQIRYYRRDGDPKAWMGYVSVEYKGGGGEVKNLEPFSFTLHGQGERVPITNPAA
ncbi:phage tail tube protein [Nonomuraea sp. NPDC004354]